jgi:hypothetical protein
VFFLALAFFGLAHASVATPLRLNDVKESVVRDDLKRILKEAKLPEDLITVTWSTGPDDFVAFECSGKSVNLKVTSSPEEKSATFYRGLRGLGFLFPHPRWQISPTETDIKRHCGHVVNWKPALIYRGLHLHTLHPNEWVRGFFMDRPEVALETVRWSARNSLNILDISLLRRPSLEELSKKFAPAFQLARDMGVHTGVSLGVALQQQKSYKLLNLFQAITGLGADSALERELRLVMSSFDTSFIVLEAGTSEFTPTGPENLINWLNLASKIARENGKVVFTKIHVSTNQNDKEWGNYNFLPARAHPGVGVLPHTVMFYSLNDEKAPMYGNKNFHAMRDFMAQETKKRPTWYYPETGYWVAMDVDIPLFLTDYLRSRAEDLKWLYENKVEGQLIFSTGHAMGGWLYDWTQALLVDSELKFDPYVGLELLGEDRAVWEKIFAYQKTFFKDQGVIAMISAANLQDELSSTHRIHDRFTMKQVADDQKIRDSEINLLTRASQAWPDTSKVKDSEIQRLLQITQMRLEHAIQIREAMRPDPSRDTNLENAQELRWAAMDILKLNRADKRNYADIGMLDVWPNPTGYQFGYIYPAASLYWWEREARQVKEKSYWPFTGNIYDIIEILL